MLATVLSLSGGCENDDGFSLCTAMVDNSVVVTVVDAQTGQRIADAMVEYRIDGGSLQEPSPISSPDRGEFSLGEDESGHFEVTVTASGYHSAMAEYHVSSGECGPETITETIELEPT